MYSETELSVKLQVIFGLDKGTAEGVVNMAKEHGEYIELCECLRMKQASQEVS